MTVVDISDLETVPRPVLVRRSHYPAGDRILPHSHRRSQLLCALEGMAIVIAERNRWLILPDHALWIPAGVRHSVETIDNLTTGSIYVEPGALSGQPAQSHVVRMSELMKSLLAEAVKLPHEYDPAGRAGLIMALILEEIPLLPRTPLSLPMPREARLAALCRQFIAAPAAHETIDGWAAEMAMSRSAFTRAFRRETGMAVLEWRQQACLLAALPRLMSGERIANVAFDLGYDSAAAFTTMFKRGLGVPPRRYIAAAAGISSAARSADAGEAA
jgi:AraC-like DNA-binding protein